jgi:hypothetical protein
MHGFRRSARMRTFKFAIVDSRVFTAEAQLPSEEMAWQEALRLVRDIESSLRLGEPWVLTVSENDDPIFRISVTSENMRTHPRRRP